MNSGDTLYQIVAEGQYTSWSERGKYMSQKVFTSPPSEDEIEEFKQACAKSNGELLDMSLKYDTIAIRVNKLMLIIK